MNFESAIEILLSGVTNWTCYPWTLHKIAAKIYIQTCSRCGNFPLLAGHPEQSCQDLPSEFSGIAQSALIPIHVCTSRTVVVKTAKFVTFCVTFLLATEYGYCGNTSYYITMTTLSRPTP